MHRSLMLIALATFGCGYQSISSPSHSAIAAFHAASLIPMTNPSTTDQTKRAWDHTIRLPTDATVRVTGMGWIGGDFSVHYSDEPAPRIVGRPGDYVYPSAIRLDSNKRVLYCLAQGYRPIGNTPVTLLFIFDLQRRESIQSYNIKNGIIPNP